MNNIKLSCIVPSYKDPLLHKTIDDLLAKSELGDQLEIIVVLDGYWTNVIQDPRVRVLHLGRNRGMRDAINAGVSIARGEFLMRLDEHQIFGQGYDRILVDSCQPNWIVTPRRYFLDADKWEVMDKPPVETMKLRIVGKPGKFSGVEWPDRDLKYKDQPLVESQAMQGSCWVMSRKWWDDVIGELQTEGYGPLIQDSHEMVFKTWKAGGKLMVNKNTWHAHKHRSFARTHNNGTPENPANCEAGYKYAIDTWGEYYREFLATWKDKEEPKMTCLYYSSNREDPVFEAKIIENLKNNCQLPIISITQQPMDLGTNICVGNVGLSYVNVFRQILIGAKAATTEYVIYAESDFLYPKEYFNFNPTEDVYLYDNVWIVFPPEVAQSYRRKIYSEGAQIVKRTLLIEKFEEFLKNKPMWFDGHLKLDGEEPFRHWKSSTPRFTGDPCISFKTGNGVSKLTNTLRGDENRKRVLPLWGHVDDLRKKYLGRT